MNADIKRPNQICVYLRSSEFQCLLVCQSHSSLIFLLRLVLSKLAHKSSLVGEDYIDFDFSRKRQ
jgi:hypothetical protein